MTRRTIALALVLAALTAPRAADAQPAAKNLRTARALGVTIPPSVLLRADQVLE